MSWTELIIEIDRDSAEILSDALMESGALSVSIEDADLGTPDEQPIFGEPGMHTPGAWQRSVLIVLVDNDVDADLLLTTAGNATGIATSAFQRRPVAEQDWVRLTQAQFGPMLIGKSIWVIPSWHDEAPPEGTVLRLDPGLAFGTGSHPTTRLCMEWLEQRQPTGLSLLDYGCGTGILAIVAAKLGAAPAWGTDIDKQALIAARDNTARNECVISYALPDQLPQQTFQIVVANILSGPLVMMAESLVRHVSATGTLVLSGILAEQADAVIAAYAPWINLEIWKESEGWVVVYGSNKKEISA